MYLDILTPLFNMSVNSTEFGIGQGEGFHTASTHWGHPKLGLQAAIPFAVLGRSCGVKRERQSRLAK